MKKLTITTAHVVTTDQLVNEALKLYAERHDFDARCAIIALLNAVGISYNDTCSLFAAAEEEAK